MKELAPGIVIFDNIFINSMEYIDKIKQNNILWKKAEVLNDKNKSTVKVKNEYRDTDIISLPHHLKLGTGVLADFAEEFHKQIKLCLDKYTDHYSVRVTNFDNPQLLRYGKEQKFNNHIDDHPLFTRRISLTYYLNDNYEGGDVEFSKHKLKFKAQKNQLLIFPSNFMYNHEVHPVTSGLRYVIVQWIA